MTEAKQEYVGTMLVVFNGNDAPIPITGLLEIGGEGFNVLLWKAEGKDGKPTKLSYNGSLNYTGDDKKTKRGYVSLLKPAPDAGKKYVMYGFIKTEVEGGEFETTHMVYLYKHDYIQGILRGGVSEHEERESSYSNIPGVPSARAEQTNKRSKQQEINYDDIPF